MAEPLDFSRLPAFGVSRPEEKKQPAKGLVAPSLRAGLADLVGPFGSAAQGAGKLFGLRTVEDFGRGVSEDAQAASIRYGRPDLEIAPWKEGGASVLPWLAYQALKQVPMIATYMVGGRAYSKLGGTAPRELQKFGAVVPKALGGGGARLGASVATRRAAVASGKDLATQMVGGSIAGLPIAFGSMIQEADQKPGGATIQDAQKAALLSPIYSALDALQPAALKGLLKRGQAGGIVRRVATASLAGAAAEVPQEGMQTALELSFRSDMPMREKLGYIVDAAVTGGAVGGVFGGAGGIRRMQHADPTSLATEDIAAVVDEALNQQGPPRQLPGPGDLSFATDESFKATGPSEFEGRPIPPPRPYEGISQEELQVGLGAAQKAITAGNASEEVKRFAEEATRELGIRNGSSTNNAVASDSVGAVQRGAEPSAGDGGDISSAPAPASQPDWTTERDTLLKGIATRKWYRDAKTPDELDTVLRARLENGSTAKSDFELAKRRGIDLNAPAAPAVEAAPTEVTAANTSGERVSKAGKSEHDPAFAAQWRADVQKLGQKDKGARSIKPVDEQDAKAQIYQALGRDAEIGDGLERLAQKYGILDEEKRLTPEAVEIAKREPISTETAVKAARAQGFKGAAASVFDRGVRAFLGGEPVTEFASTRESEAYAAGARWAEEHNSVPRGALKKYEPGRYTGAVTDDQVAAMNAPAKAPQPRVIPPEVREQQAANNVIDSSVSATNDDTATLKKMVRDGDIDGAMQALQRVQAGESLFQQPEPTRTPARGVVATRGAPRTGESTTVMVPTKGASRAAAEQAIRKYELSRAIDAAHAEGVIDGKERLKLVAKLRQGRVAEVTDAIPVTFSGQKALRPTSLMSRTAQREAIRAQLEEAARAAETESEVAELSVDENGVFRPAQFQGTVPEAQARAVQEMLEGKSAKQVVELLEQKAPSGFHREVAKRLRTAMAQLSRAGFQFEFHIAGPGDANVPALLQEARGLTVDYPETNVTAVWINGLDGPGPTGLSYEVVLHEMLHAVTMQSIAHVEATGRYDTQLGKAVQDLQSVTDAIQAHFSNRRRQGNLTDLESFILESNALDDAHEVLAYALSSPQFQSYLDTIDYTPRQTLWGRFVEAMRTFLGLGARADGALVEVLRASEQIMAFGPVEAELEMAGLGAGVHMMSTPGVAPATNEATQKIVSQLDEALNRIPIKTITGGALKLLVGWMPQTHITEHYKRIFPEMGLLQNAHAARRATTAVFAHLYNEPKLLVERMSQTKEGKAALRTISELMELTAWDIDYAKSWADNDHLHGVDNEDVLKRLHAEGHRKYNALKGTGQNQLIEQYRQINEMEHFASMSLAIRQLIAGEPAAAKAIADFEVDPVETFRNNSALHNPLEARKYWRGVLQGLIASVEDYTTSVRGAGDQKASVRLSPIEKYVREVKKGLQSMDQAPYFHLGRQGEHTVFGSVRLGTDKKVDLDAVDHVARELEKIGVTDARISRDLNKPQIFLRVETPERRDLIAGTMLRLQREGWLNPDIEVTRGVREEGEFLPERTRAEMNRFVNALRSDPLFEITDSMMDSEKEAVAALRDRTLKTAYDVWLDMLPDTATSKVLTHRESKPGFSTNMARSFAFRYNIAVNSIASLAAEPQLNEAFEKMRGRLNDAKVADQEQDVDTIATLYAEATRREAERPLASKADGYDTWRAWTHAFYLGLSPSYVLLNMTQIGVLLWPELSKQHGFVKTAKALAKVTPLAFDILRVTMKQGYEAGGVLRAADGVITQEALQKALGTDKSTTEFMMNMIGSGIIDIGSAARELATVAEGREDSSQGKMLRFAASAGLYSETFTRLVAALSARELHKGSKEETIDYAKNVVRESMLEYSTWNVARKMGKMGIAGEFTPVMMSFLQYSTQVTWKLYRELSTAFLDRAANETEKTEAKRFLTNHLVAVTTLAGTLGLPFATVAVAVLEKLVDLFDDDETPFDATAAWRNYLHDTFGDAIGDMLARGVTRGAGYGFDISTRAGEQSLLPFSQWLTDKRKFKDATEEAALRSLGAPVSMAGSIADGFGKISDGDVLGGLTAMMPSAIRGPAQAFRMYEDGYTDTLGNKLPISPRGTDYLIQLIGLTPHAKAEYSEARGDQAARESVLVHRAGVLRKQIADAILSGDDEAARDAIRRAQSFDAANPAFAVLPDIDSSVERRMRSQAIAAKTRTPIGVNPKDRQGRELTQYADIEFAPQR